MYTTFFDFLLIWIFKFPTPFLLPSPFITFTRLGLKAVYSPSWLTTIVPMTPLWPCILFKVSSTSDWNKEMTVIQYLFLPEWLKWSRRYKGLLPKFALTYLIRNHMCTIYITIDVDMMSYLLGMAWQLLLFTKTLISSACIACPMCGCDSLYSSMRISCSMHSVYLWLYNSSIASQ